MEKLEPEEKRYAQLEEAYQGFLAEWRQSAEYWALALAEKEALVQENMNLQCQQEFPEYLVSAKTAMDEAWERWHEQCMEWYDVYEEEYLS